VTHARRRTGRPSSFSREQLISAALEIGPHGLSLRAVADLLRVPHTTVYNHVKSTEELGRLVLSDQVTKHELELVPPPDAPWDVWLETFAERTYAKLAAAQGWLQFWSPQLHVSPRTLESADRLLARMVDAGFTIEAASRAFSCVSGVVSEAASVRGRRAALQPANDYFTGLSAEDYPWIAAAVRPGSEDEDEAQFRFNLRCALEGIRAASGRAPVQVRQQRELEAGASER
jgi:AcrR family transcriptional regulator